MGQEDWSGGTNNYDGTNNGLTAQAGHIDGGVHYQQIINGTPEPPRQNNNLRNGCLGCGVLGFLLLAFLLVVNALTIPRIPQYGTPTTFGQPGPISTGGAASALTPPAAHTVVYSVTGSDAANFIMYYTDSGANQIARVPLPWSKTFTMPPAAHLGLEAQSEGQYGPGQLTVTITVDGKVVKTNTGVGAAHAEAYVDSPAGG